MCLLMLTFHRMISRTAIDILTINANAHSQTLNYARVKQYLLQFYRLFSPVAKQRLDKLLVERELCVSRQLAQRLIQAGEVRVKGEIVDKVGTEVPVDALIEVKQRPRFVSRGGEKLIKALEEFPISVIDRVCLDGGISTGGFTDCLFQAGAKLVYGIDVGYGQVDWKIRTDDRLVLKERVNLRHLTAEQLYNVESLRPDLGVVDVSFISLGKVLPALANLLVGNKELVLLVKPQFEVGREAVGKNGVVRDAQTQAGAIEGVLTAANSLGWCAQGLTFSPLVGPAGNIEFLLWLSLVDQGVVIDRSAITTVVNTAQASLA
jgi:23S rRNA (cytidine1920-2'-O)/16S rRNA (cytidine1409-2'-O)-methyltransferase